MRYHQLGVDGPTVSSVCLGTSGLGDTPGSYRPPVGEEQAVATVRRALASAVTFLDTSNEYGHGRSELRIGAALRDAGERPEVVIASKADPEPGSSVLDGERVRQSYRESVERLGVDHLEVYYLHDPERFDVDYLTGPGGALDAMRQLKAEGRVRKIGVAGGDVEELHRYLDTGHVDVLLNHNRFTLLDQSAAPLIDHALAAGAAFVNAAPYASGILAQPPEAGPRYQYRIPEPGIIEQVRDLRSLCESAGVPLAALALQFSTCDPRISSTVVGVSAPDRVDDVVRNEEREIPRSLWEAVSERLSIPVPPAD